MALFILLDYWEFDGRMSESIDFAIQHWWLASSTEFTYIIFHKISQSLCVRPGITPKQRQTDDLGNNNIFRATHQAD